MLCKEHDVHEEKLLLSCGPDLMQMEPDRKSPTHGVNRTLCR